MLSSHHPYFSVVFPEFTEELGVGCNGSVWVEWLQVIPSFSVALGTKMGAMKGSTSTCPGQVFYELFKNRRLAQQKLKHTAGSILLRNAKGTAWTAD